MENPTKGPIRELGVLPLHTAIHKMTRMPADRIGLEDRGRIATGSVADIVVFDPNAQHHATTTRSRSRNAPNLGRSWRGAVRYTVHRGSHSYLAEPSATP